MEIGAVGIVALVALAIGLDRAGGRAMARLSGGESDGCWPSRRPVVLTCSNATLTAIGCLHRSFRG
jgi:hypothetical protein